MCHQSWRVEGSAENDIMWVAGKAFDEAEARAKSEQSGRSPHGWAGLAATLAISNRDLLVLPVIQLTLNKLKINT